MSTGAAFTSPHQAEREVRNSWRFFAATFVAMVLNGFWTLLMGTASFGADESDLVRGWTGVARNLPGYELFVGAASMSVWFAVRAGMHGSDRARPALVGSSLVLLFALSSVTRDSAEVVMTTRAATVSWVLFGADALLVGAVFLAARRRIGHSRSW